MKFRAVSNQTKFNYLLWSVKKEINSENKYLRTLGYDPEPTIAAVKQHIDKWDPIRLLALECPADEYDCETREISIVITKHLADIDNNLLSKAINKVFTDSFRTDFNNDHESIEVANNIIDSLKSNNSIK
jgi:hypothetical protein